MGAARSDLHRRAGLRAARRNPVRELMFQVIADRAEKAVMIVTTNLPFSEWSQVDRLTDQAHIITMGADSSVPPHRRPTQGRCLMQPRG